MKTHFGGPHRLLLVLGVLATGQIALGATLLTPNNIVANQYHAVAGSSQDRPGALSVATDGIVDHGASGQNNGFDTWPAGNGLTDNAFAGLTYTTPERFTEVVAQMGHQFADGGNWASLPNLYVLTKPSSALPNNGQTPPDQDSADWTLVPTADYTVVSGSPSGTDAIGAGPSVPYDYLMNSYITGFGWAIGGVASPSNGSNFVSITELQGFGTTAPEPSSFVALAGLGAMGLFLVARRRRKT
jgi:hypothetical protein